MCQKQMDLDLSQERLSTISSDLDECSCESDIEKEILQASLLTLTTHFAQVQLRIRQIINSPIEERDEFLEDLEKFAFKDATTINQTTKKNPFSFNVDKTRRINGKTRQLLRKLKILVKKLRDYNPEHQDTCKRIKIDLDVKSQLEQQLKDQIDDLERYIKHMKEQKPECYCKNKEDNDFLRKIWSFIQMFAFVNFTAFNVPNFNSKNENKRHWGELRAKLELAILNVKDLVTNREKSVLIRAVRNDLTRSISDLIQHGTKPQNALLSSFCLSTTRRTTYSGFTHSWDIILDYYILKEGDKFNSSIQQKLAKSFNLDLDDECENHKKTSKKKLLSTIADIISIHSPYRRSQDSHFRAFVCAGLNNNRLVVWLNLIFQCNHIVQMHYYPWSYVATTRCKDGLKSLDLLTDFKFDLPVDLEVRKFRDLDVFV